MSSKRENVQNAKKVHLHWASKVENNYAVMVKLLGEDACEYIRLGGGEQCYACGSESHLHKCHIIPHGCGGSGKNDNIFLMCLRCHQDNPDSIHEDMFFHYVRHRRSHMNYCMDSVFKIFKQLELEASEDELEKINRFGGLSMDEMLAHHESMDNQSICTGLNNQMSVSTSVMALWKNIMLNWNPPSLASVQPPLI